MTVNLNMTLHSIQYFYVKSFDSRKHHVNTYNKQTNNKDLGVEKFIIQKFFSSCYLPTDIPAHIFFFFIFICVCILFFFALFAYSEESMSNISPPCSCERVFCFWESHKKGLWHEGVWERIQSHQHQWQFQLKINSFQKKLHTWKYIIC